MSEMTVAELIDAVKRQLPSSINYNDRVQVTLSDGIVSVALEPDPIDELPSVTVADRLASILGLTVHPDRRLVVLHYLYQSGYEVVRDCLSGEPSFSGQYHPDVACEGGGVCIWCGRTLVFV